ncbi:hypothetical protein Tco_0630142 [Tanacetum coccineum]
MNLSPKQSEVRHVINVNNLAVCAILESHIASSRLDVICSRVFHHWNWTSNSSSCSKGTRIILGWNADIVDTSIITQDDQVMHTRLWIKADKKEVFCSFIYAHNRYTQHHELWRSLCKHKCFIRNRPWCMLGDFNAALKLEDMSVGSSNFDIAMREFNECVEEIEVSDVARSGLQFTWNQKPHGADGILKKLDRVMANLEFHFDFVGAFAVFRPYGILDHAPAVLRIPVVLSHIPRPFKFANVTASLPRFKEVVIEGWGLHVSGFHMFCVVKKLKCLKNPLRKLLYEKGNLHENVNNLRVELEKAQLELDSDPSNFALREKEAEFGDGCWCLTAFVSHYKAFLGQSGYTIPLHAHDLFMNRLHPKVALDMVNPVTTQEVKEAIFSMGNDKSPGPDGYTACFFKESWDIMASDVILAVQEFFVNGKLLKELNHTIIALIPKVASPSRINDYRPISYCNVLFKCISKIIANHIKESLKDLISPNQSAFVQGRRITDNILLVQELMHNYHLDMGSPRCAFKVESQKAYDTVDWGFLKEVLIAFGFHDRMVGWIMECVTTTSFSLSINGVLHGYFKDDLFLFAHGDSSSARVIIEALDEFQNSSGLMPSLPKSTTYFCNVLNHMKLSILQILPFDEGRLLVKYLGVPLVTSRLVYRD